MAGNFITVEIKPGDTPDSIAAAFGVPRSAVTAPEGFWVGGTVQVQIVNTGTVDNVPSTTPSTTTTTGSTDARTTSGGFVTFNILTDQGPVQVPVRFDGATWTALLNSPLADKYGLSDSEPQIQIGLSDNFIADAKSFLAPDVVTKMQTPLESLSFFKEVQGAGNANLPPLSPEMMASGIAWAQDPATGDFELIDSQPLVGPPLTAFKFTPTDPNNPSAGGNWVVVPDLATENRSIFEGVPTSVQPWLQYALDNGGDYNVVPEGPAREWVKFILTQTARSSSRPPDQMPFGIGLPNFPGGVPGSTVPGASNYTPVPTGAKPTTSTPAPATPTQKNNNNPMDGYVGNPLDSSVANALNLALKNGAITNDQFLTATPDVLSARQRELQSFLTANPGKYTLQDITTMYTQSGLPTPTPQELAGYTQVKPAATPAPANTGSPSPQPSADSPPAPVVPKPTPQTVVAPATTTSTSVSKTTSNGTPVTYDTNLYNTNPTYRALVDSMFK